MSAFDYDGRVFRSVRNSPDGDVGDATRFEYRQEGAIVWATYQGGGVVWGTLLATTGDEGTLDMRYQHVGTDGAIKAGRCLSRPERLPDGRLRLTETWTWTEGGTGLGTSTIEEVMPEVRASIHVRTPASSEHYWWGRSSEGWRLLDRADLSVIRERMPPGDTERSHRHRRARQLFVVLSGTLDVELGNTTLSLGSSAAIEIPPGTVHAVRNRASQDAHFLVISTPSTRLDRQELR